MKGRIFILFLLLWSLHAYTQTCTLAINLTASNTTICSGNPAILSANASSGTPGYNYVWSTGETTPTISINRGGTYSVTVNDQTPGCSPVTKSITIANSDVPNSPTVASARACPNTPVTLTATAPGGTYQWYDAPTGGNFLATGASYTTPIITAPTIFYVETTLNGCTSTRTAVPVSLITGPTSFFASTCAGSPITLFAQNSDSYQWYDAPTGGHLLSTGDSFTTPVLFTTTIYYLVGTTNGCVSSAVPVTAFVTPSPAAPTASSVNACSGSVTTLHASSSTAGAVFDWFASATSVTSLITSPDYTTPALTGTTTYYVQATVNGCVSPRTAVTVNVNTSPDAPTVGGATTICSGSATILTATASATGTYQWFDTPTSITPLSTGNIFTTPVLYNSTIYYVEISNGTCTSSRTAVNVTANPTPDAPTAPGQNICTGNVATVTAAGSGSTYQWYDAATGGNLLFSGDSHTTGVLTANVTYYVQTTTAAGCVSPRTAVTVTVNSIPVAPTANGASVCSGSVATLSASGTGSTYEWYDAATGGNLLASTQSFTTPALSGTTTYYVQNLNNGCASPRTPVTVTVTAIPDSPTVSPAAATICAGTSTSLTATSSLGTIEWYKAATGGTLLFTGNTYNTGALAATTTYYVQATNGTCTSERTAVTVTVTSTTNQFAYSSGTYCTASPDQTPAINVPGGTFSASSGGLSIDAQSGTIHIAASTPGTYTVLYSNHCTLSSETISIVTAPNATFNYSATSFCQGDAANPSPTFALGATGGRFSVPPTTTPGLVFADATSGTIDLTNSAPGTYTITNTIDLRGVGCGTLTMATTTVTINPQVVISAGPDQTVGGGLNVQLAGSVSGAPGATWSTSGTGTFSNATDLHAFYIPGGGETSVTLTLTSMNPGNACGPKSSTVNITINPIPLPPTTSGDVTICSGNLVTLTAAGPADRYDWHDTPTGGVSLHTGANYIITGLTTPTTYYVQSTVNGVSSNRTAVTVTVNPTPTKPVVAGGVIICSGDLTTLTASSTTPGATFAWYDAATGGNIQSSGSTFTTPHLTGSITYYVQATLGTCTSARTRVDVTVNPTPTVTSATSGTICSGNEFVYNITSNITGTTFNWSRALVTGISNLPANQTSSTIDETLINTTGAPINVVYVITPTFGSCSGTSFNYTVTVNPTPVVTSLPAITVCNGTTVDYDIIFNTPGVVFSWSRALVTGISNAPITGQQSNNIQELLINTTNTPIDVTYVINYYTPACAGGSFNLVVTINPIVTISSPTTGKLCSGATLNYAITSNVANTVYSWSRPAQPGLSNGLVTNNTSGLINETLINTGNTILTVPYTITTIKNGCQTQTFTYTVTLYPHPVTPVANSNSPICSGSTINLFTPTYVAGGTYLWTGPNGFTSSAQNPVINNITSANAGTYTLQVLQNGCTSDAATVNITVNPPPVVNAGPDQAVCRSENAISLAGTVNGGTITGIWTTNGTGTFLPAANQLNGQYIPSAEDKANGSVKLILASTSRDNCTITFDDMLITFQTLPGTDAGPDQSVCYNNNGVALNGKMLMPGDGVWTSSGTGTFSPSSAQINGAASPQYIPSAADLANGSVTLTLTANNTDVCYFHTDQVVITILPQIVTPVATSNSPVCSNTTITLLTTTSVPGATYLWTGPNGFTSTLQNPSISNATAANAGTYTLYLVLNGCSSAGGTVNITIDTPPVTNAGPDQLVCTAGTAVTLAGNITGSMVTGIWTTSGTGTFSPSATQWNAQYLPSAQDKANGSVKLTLASTNTDNCTISTDDMVITFQTLPGTDAGADQSVCNQVTLVPLSGNLLIPGNGAWTTSGSGSFSPSAVQVNGAVSPQYIPSADDIANGKVTLTLTTNNTDPCYYSSDQMVITFIPPPTIQPATLTLIRGQTYILNPVVSDDNVTYLWKPNTSINNITIKNPTITATVDGIYTLQVTDIRGCVSTATFTIKVAPDVAIPNTFTPNGDGINDLWNIQGLSGYRNATVDIFTRAGEKVFHSVGYGVAWDGTYNGKQLPFGTYYYIIHTNPDNAIYAKTYSGYIVIVR